MPPIRSPDVKIGQIRGFVAVVEEQGFKAAAQRLFKSQPAVSLAVQELENLLGANLFERGGSTRLTPFGAQFHPIARRLLDDYEAALALTMEIVNVERGVVRVAAVPSLARQILPQAIAAFMKSHPEVNLHLSDGHTELVRDAVLAGDADLGLCGAVTSDSRLLFTPILSDRMGVVCSVKHRLAAQSEVAWTDLREERVIDNGTLRLLSEGWRKRIAGTSRVFIANTTSLLAVVEADIGVTILPELAYPKGSTRLHFAPLCNPGESRAIGLLVRQLKSLSPAATAFRASVMDTIATLGRMDNK